MTIKKQTKKCKFCNAEMLIDYLTCPQCGGIQDSKKEKFDNKHKNNWKI